jgi:pyridoxal phosphate enzyme (YggS family)
MEKDNNSSKHVEMVKNVEIVEDILDDDLDEPTLPKKNVPDLNNLDLNNLNLNNLDLNNLNLNNSDKMPFDLTKMMSSLQSKNPKDLRKMISKMGITQAQINQMKQNYENSTDTGSNLPEADARTRLREKLNKKISCLLQIYIAKEETKFGLDEVELENIIQKLPQLPFVQISGMMGMASFSSDSQIVKNEFDALKQLFNKYSTSITDNFKMETLSMGMSGDYKMAISCGSNMVRIGSMLFGEREYKK